MSNNSRMTGSRRAGLSTTSTFLVEILTTPGVTACRIGATERFSNGGMWPASHASVVNKAIPNGRMIDDLRLADIIEVVLAPDAALLRQAARMTRTRRRREDD